MKKAFIMCVAMAVLVSPGFASAADWNFYGSARVSTFYSKIDNDMFHGGADTSNFEQNFHGNSRIGARVKVSDELTGAFEYGALGGNVSLRQLWGEWNFGAGKLVVGHAYTPFLVVTNQAYNLAGLNLGDTGMAYFGTMYSGREALIGLKIGGLYVAAVEQETDVYNSGGGTPSMEVKTPELHARYMFKGEKWMTQILGGLSRFDVQQGSNDGDVTSYLVGLSGRLNIGKAYISGGGWVGQNAGNLIDQYVSLNPNKSGQHFANWNGTAVIDNDGSGVYCSAGYVFNQSVRMEAGYGYSVSELDTADSVEDDVVVYYLQSTITLAPGVMIVPEIGRLDFKDSGLGALDSSYVGMKWQVNF